MINLKIICFFEDVDLSMNLGPICNNNNYDLIFPDYSNFNQDLNNIAMGVVIIDMEEEKYKMVDLIGSIYKNTYFPIIGYKNKINKKIKNEATDIGYDIVIDKETLKRNLSVICKQIIKEIKDKSNV